MAEHTNGQGLRPLLDLDTAAPDRIPVGITANGERKVYTLRHPDEFSTRERKRISSLLRAIVEFEQSEEDQLVDSDYDAYDAALSEVTSIAMPDVPLNVLHSMSPVMHGKVAAHLVRLFTQTGPGMEPEMTEDEPIKPTRLRALKEKLTSAKSSPGSVGSTADDRETG